MRDSVCGGACGVAVGRRGIGVGLVQVVGLVERWCDGNVTAPSDRRTPGRAPRTATPVSRGGLTPARSRVLVSQSYQADGAGGRQIETSAFGASSEAMFLNES
ncbi:hypothetical protein NDU88_002237 [Pleurodeles waltl]|uniref:Uncharacterized protein n=1 Tax=Pleurodeles waltl TaxID=8319 RepID=A0AAV7LZZ0_PLEWA|nr:hypothetical protein NDU88_002237 [Pleurodeles waltl]